MTRPGIGEEEEVAAYMCCELFSVVLSRLLSLLWGFVEERFHSAGSGYALIIGVGKAILSIS